MHKNELTRAFQLTQFYGETLEHLRYVIHGEGEILEKKFYGAADIINLLDLRTRRGRFEMLLIDIRRQINELNGVIMPIGGWVTNDL